MASIKTEFKVHKIESWQAKEWFLKKHYAKRVPQSSYLFGLFRDGVLLGVCSFGIPANNFFNEPIKGYKGLELNRLIVDGNLVRNALSFFVSNSISKIEKPVLIVSYADTAKGHHGYIYQATNWIYTGLGSSDIEFKKNGKTYHRKQIFNKYGTGSKGEAIKKGYEVIKQKPKHRYFYLHASKTDKRKMLKDFPFEILPYPKGENRRYDAGFKPSTQMRLDF